MSLTRDMQELMGRVKRTPGYTVSLTKGGHWQVRDLNDRLLVVAPSTPSDWRGVKNTVSDLRKAGVPLEGKTKYDNKPDPDGEQNHRLRRDLPESQRRLIANINSYLHEQGFDPGAKTNKSRTEFVNAMLRVGPQKGLKTPKSRASADQSLTRLLVHGGRLTAWMEALMSATLETLWEEKEQAAQIAAAVEVHGQDADDAARAEAEAKARAEAEHAAKVEEARQATYADTRARTEELARASAEEEQEVRGESERLARGVTVVTSPPLRFESASSERGEVAEANGNGHAALTSDEQFDLLLRLTTALSRSLREADAIALVKEVRAQLK